MKTIKKGKGESHLALCPFFNSMPLINHIQPQTLRWTQFLIPYFLLNFSTRPAESTNFCLPVKKGWHWEQISTWIFGTVERVSTTFPQAQVIVAVLYSGWIPSFIMTPSVAYTTIKPCLQIPLFFQSHLRPGYS